jgi:hypothetical protein
MVFKRTIGRLRSEMNATGRISRRPAAGLVLLMLAGLPWVADAGTLTLRVRAINPSATDKQPVEVKAFLPKLARPETVVSAGEFEVAYDVGAKAYYVRQKVELEPGQTRTFEVVLNDIWVVPEETLRELASHARALQEATQGSEQAETARKVGVVVDEALKAVEERQRTYAVGTAKPVDHIRAHESNLQALEQVRKDVGVLENLVIAAGKDPGRILGAARLAPPDVSDLGRSTDRVVVLHIKVSNPSLTERKSPPLRRDLPAEIKSTDIVDAGGLQVGFDAGKGMTYVYAEAVELPPQQSREFEVRVRNPWFADDEYLERLRERAATLVKVARDSQSYTSVVADAERLASDVAVLATNVPPATLNEEYVAFARQRLQRLRELDAGLMRLDELFQPRRNPQPEFGAPVLNVKPPSRETTWRIIYIILGFLGAFSALFFLRWYGRGKAETLAGGGPGSSSPPAPPPGPERPAS